MIIVRLNGGLGNQLFQYATARALSLRTSSELAVDARVYQTDVLRRYCLDHFATKGAVYNASSDADCPLPPPRDRLWSYLRWRCMHGRRLKYVRERGLGFDSSVLGLGRGAYLHGYWQCERYFADAADVLRRELTVQTRPSPENASWLRDIASGPSVSVHVRRGDYVTVAKVGQVHGTCAPEYYRKAAELVCDRLGVRPTFYVFSDDPAWAAANIALPARARYVSHNDDEHNYEDLRLMAACSHHIVANSSFSWWGAWLAANSDKIVVAPARWFRDPKKDDRHLVPSAWHRV